MKIAVLLLLTLPVELSFGQSLKKIWSAEGLKTPESAHYDPETNQIFVSNVNGNPSEKDGNGFISILSTDGKIKNLNWVSGLNAPKGLGVYNGNLYATDIDQLVEINIAKSQIVNRYPVKDAKFLNDIAISNDGTVFISDSDDDKIYALKDGKLSLWLENKVLESPNGLWADQDNLYVGTTSILRVTLQTKKVTALIDHCNGIDGLEKLSNGKFIYSNWEGRIFITENRQSVQLLNTVGKSNTADIEYEPSLNLLLVPTFFSNRVDAYQLVK
jgi:outer membrane protein assembly factor BamB